MELTLKQKCDTKSRNVLRVNATLSIWSNPTVTCTGIKAGRCWCCNGNYRK